MRVVNTFCDTIISSLLCSGVVRELIVSGSGEEDMSALLCGMHAAPNDALRLKLHILKALLGCLRDSHRTRTIFRKVLYTISIERNFLLTRVGTVTWNYIFG